MSHAHKVKNRSDTLAGVSVPHSFLNNISCRKDKNILPFHVIYKHNLVLFLRRYLISAYLLPV